MAVDAETRAAPASIGMYVVPNGPTHGMELLTTLERLGLDTAWVGDTLGDWRHPDQPLLDAWPVLGAYAVGTERIGLGMLVTNLSWRRPVEAARFAMSVDRLSQGRFTLGVGCGPLDDQAMAGDAVATMVPKERVDRLEEGLTVLDRLLRGDVRGFEGRFTSFSAAAMAPGPVQRPRLPLTVAGNGPRVVRLAARHADTWNTFVDTDDVDGFFEQTVTRVADLEAYVRDIGREPSTLRRSVLAFDEAFDAWERPGAITDFVQRFAPLGFTEFVFHPPASGDVAAVVEFGTHELPELRRRLEPWSTS
jgi:alkanesulfonate monooxygenase SsuD/methylene tetrahydromethanopterin reductase-like flavin-dependent oxidoreductase (luciferase family)